MWHIFCFIKSFILSICILLASVSSAQATLIDNGLHTLDTNSGLEWLDITESMNRSYDDVSTQFGMGGDFEGYRYATTSEVFDLAAQAGISDIPGLTTGNFLPIQDLQSLLGLTQGGTNPATFAITGDAASTLGKHSSILFQVWLDPGFSLYGKGKVLQSSSWDYVEQYNIGHYLIRTSVPEPQTFALIVLGVFGLGIARQRKHTS